MKLCLNCRTVAGSAANFCATCRYSFGVRRCSRGHANARSATSCQECGSSPLSQAVSYIDLALVVKLAVGGFALAIMALLFGPALWNALGWSWHLADGFVSAVQFAWHHPGWLIERIFVWTLLGALAWRLIPRWLQASLKWILRRLLRRGYRR